MLSPEQKEQKLIEFREWLLNYYRQTKDKRYLMWETDFIVRFVEGKFFTPNGELASAGHLEYLIEGIEANYIQHPSIYQKYLDEEDKKRVVTCTGQIGNNGVDIDRRAMYVVTMIIRKYNEVLKGE